MEKDKTLGSRFPDVAAQWHPTKNGELTPEDVSYGSGKKMWWICSKGHEWQAMVFSRTSGCGCPVCSTLALEGRPPRLPSLSVADPKLAAEWHPTRNGDLTPEKVSCGSGKRVWWLGFCGHEWQSRVADRARGTRGIGCPVCNKPGRPRKKQEKQNIIDLFKGWQGQYEPVEIDWGEPVGAEILDPAPEQIQSDILDQ